MPKIPTLEPEQEITDEQRDAAEAELREKQKIVDYDTKEYPVEVLVQKYREGLNDNTNELYIPDYQRNLVWSDRYQSKFIESIFLGLPISAIFVAELRIELHGEDIFRLEIIDGTQRIQTLYKFLDNRLKLCGLERLINLNGFRFDDLPLARKRRFNRATVRVIVLSERADEEVRRDIFERVNTANIIFTEKK
jgi:hypothetical protein